MGLDISSILEDWASDSEKNLRQIYDHNGREILQIRIDQGPFQGILQIYLEGRPDGREPYGFVYVLDRYESMLEKVLRDGGDASSFSLNKDECAELIDESKCIYERYAFLFQLAEYKSVIRDTNHNMRLLKFVSDHAMDPEDSLILERWWPYLIRINGSAKAMMAVEKGDLENALRLIAKSRTRIEKLADVDIYEFHVEKERSFKSLDELTEKLSSERPLSEKEKIIDALEMAILDENYESAAVLRDQLKNIE
jgi:hypothetical protein